jgi:signal transduction histidine kinase/CheY-like chemotaxis protein
MDETQVVGGMALAVQLGTAIYALRLNRLFGSRRAGWSLFGAFALMVAVHLSEASDWIDGHDPTDHRMSQLVYLASSGLLLIGLAHVGMIFRERLRTEEAVRASREVLEERVRQRTAELAAANTSLQWEIKDRQRAEAAKLECIGRLAGGVAHDFNNLLTIIQGNSAYALTVEPLPDSVRDSLNEVQSASDRAAQITRQLVAVARGQRIRAEVLDLNEVIRRTLKHLQRPLSESIRVTIDSDSKPVIVKADPAMLEQMLACLVINAKEAMPNGGDLRLTMRLTHLEARVADGLSCAAGQYAWLRIADSGRGISPDILPRIFEPFFTTKDVGQGSGLGLATVQGIVRQHRGWIEVSSIPGQGTTFDVYLPASAENIPDRAVPNVALPRAAAASLGTRTILLVEDEPGLRKLAATLLSNSGCRVLEAESGVAAIDVWDKNRDAIDLLFTDIIMPQGTNGFDLARRLKRERSSLKVLCTSGYVPDRIQSDPGIRLLPKPYTGQQLIDAVQTVLAEP